MQEHVRPQPPGSLRQTIARVRGWLSRRATRGEGSEPLLGRRRRIAGWAIAIGLIAGLIELGLPAEDAFRAVRAAVRMHPADQSVVVVAIDDKSLNALGSDEPRRSDEARFVERLFELGATRVFFDRAFADPSSAKEDRQFSRALERHRGRVFLGAAEALEYDGTKSVILPHRRFRGSAEIVSIYGEEAPFGLAMRFPTSSYVRGKEYTSLSAKLAGVNRPGEFYRPDFAIDYKTIPTVSYIDVLNGTVGPTKVRGKAVVVSPPSRMSRDYHLIPLRDWAPGVYFHVIGAETLKHGLPIDLGWLPAFIVAGLAVVAQAKRQRPSKRLLFATGAGLVFIPLALDFLGVNVDIMPSVLCLAIAWVRLHRLAQRTYHGDTGLERLENLQSAETAEDMDVLALKIRNFATISASLLPAEVDRLLANALAKLRAIDPDARFAFSKDTFVWMCAKLADGEIEDHVRGLHAMFRTSASSGAHHPDLAASIGLDTNRDAPLRERTENAMQCAEDAAHEGRLYRVSEHTRIEDRAWRLQILSEFETAVANDQVEIAYQPKVSLTTGEIVGAEALLRWSHPERGPIEPAQLVAIAEAHNRVDLITRFVLNRALSQALPAVSRSRSFKLAVNISALDLRDPTFVAQVEQILAANRFPAASLILEITETAQIDNEQMVVESLARLKRMGIQLSVDDFGTGHATLEYLRRIPSDEVKIDRSFVLGMDRFEEDRKLVRTAIEMIHSLGRRAVAEGVETQATMELLREMRCDEAQGYLFSRPITMKALIPRLSAGEIAA